MPRHSAASPIYTALARLANFNSGRRVLLASRKTSSSSARSSAKTRPFLCLALFRILVVVTAVFLFPPAIMSSSSSSSSAAAASVPFQSPRKVVKKVLSLSQSEGQGATVRRSIGGHEVRNLDPFLLLDEFSVSKPAGFPDHPHRGFETVTYMLDGVFTHQDFSGHTGTIRTGDVQWMMAGRGIVHSEMPA
uniref:Pirin N-terminal domain-containing protein n=1 Tax=Aegilops tauschii subsp. strangulata TaxID=200361 RepID=A0A453MHB8_AEGTS